MGHLAQKDQQARQDQKALLARRAPQVQKAHLAHLAQQAQTAQPDQPAQKVQKAQSVFKAPTVRQGQQDLLGRPVLQVYKDRKVQLARQVRKAQKATRAM